VGLDEVPVGHAAEESIDVIVARLRARPIERHLVPASHPGHELDPEKVSQPENRLGLAVRVSVDGVRLQDRLVFQQPVEDVDGLPDPAGNKA
jgi:hypothetical protein